ncbi:AfsR/SARP family transcriptional regulator [Gandjariella thermophila]|uniref:AfsR/SARP family transcriptional regulator n=1 Tax=Gandjariella thermophila TaxID=1931992 RepID=UPI00186518C6|nr:AfsR/SARP family transcriptional regulator [Gandjariella thermophila]
MAASACRSSSLSFRILGPLEIECGGRRITPTAPKPRAVLALLLFRVNRVVPNSVLVEELWAANPPSTALNTLQTYIFQIRKLIADALGVKTAQVARDILITDTAGYILRGGCHQLDVCEFEDLMNRGRDALDNDDHVGAAELFQRALETWRGPIALDWQSGRAIQAHVARLEEQRLYALEQRLEACLALERHREMLSELASLVVEHHLHESLHAKYMIALYRAGRVSDALTVFRSLRQRMMDELGIEPSAALQALHRAMLSSDPGLASTPAPTPPAPPARVLASEP